MRGGICRGPTVAILLAFCFILVIYHNYRAPTHEQDIQKAAQSSERFKEVASKQQQIQSGQFQVLQPSSIVQTASSGDGLKTAKDIVTSIVLFIQKQPQHAFGTTHRDRLRALKTLLQATYQPYELLCNNSLALSSTLSAKRHAKK